MDFLSARIPTRKVNASTSFFYQMNVVLHCWHRFLNQGDVAELKRTLNLAEVVFFAAGVILGAGIYAVIGKAAGAGGNMLWLSFSIAAITALLSLFAYAELVAMFPSSGGEYSFVKESVGMRLAKVVGVLVASSGIVSAATISIGFSGYLSELTEIPARLSALGIITLIFAVNAAGIRHSSVVNIIFTILETLGLLFVIYSAAPSLGETDLLELPGKGINGLMTGAAICFFAFTGFEDAVKLAEETKQPEKNIPRGLFIAALLVICLYVATAVSVVSMVPFDELASSGSPLSTVVEKRFGQTGAVIIAVVALFSTSNSLLSNMLGASRVIYNMGKESRRLRFLGKVNSGRKTPVIALVLAAGIAAAFSLIGKVETVALITNFFMFVTFLIVNGTVIYLRKKEPDRERPFRIPGTIRNVPFIPLLAMGMVLVFMGYTVYALTTGNLSS
jgi:basic amino acid/polyamine antiporter, APA family